MTLANATRYTTGMCGESAEGESELEDVPQASEAGGEDVEPEENELDDVMQASEDGGEDEEPQTSQVTTNRGQRFFTELGGGGGYLLRLQQQVSFL